MGPAGRDRERSKQDLRTGASLNMGPLTLRPFAGDNLMVVRVEGEAGSLAPAHGHPHEQITLVEKGRLRFTIDNEEVEVEAGDVLHIPSEAQHEAELLEDAVFYDIFHPVRRDLLDKLQESG